MNERYLTAKETAKLLRTTPGSLATHRQSGPPFIKLKRKILYCRDDVLRWLEDHKITTEEV